MGASLFTIPPLVFCAEGLVCRVMILTPSTITLASSTRTCLTFRGLARSLSSPAIITTLSPFLILYLGLNLAFILSHLEFHIIYRQTSNVKRQASDTYCSFHVSRFISTTLPVPVK